MDATHGIDDLLKGIKIDRHVTLDGNSEVAGFDRGAQQDWGPPYEYEAFNMPPWVFCCSDFDVHRSSSKRRD